jgi:SNF2 family DNA or RNA helicase
LLEQFSDIPIYTADLSDELISEIEKQPFDEEILDLTLRRYQVFGTKYILHQKRVLLGDEMGLGKTIQAIAAMAELSEQGRTHFLVAAPLSILRNWEREIRRACQLTPYVIHGDKRNEYRLWINKGGVAITNYETLLKLEIPEDLQIDLIAADEAHYLKNPKARRTQAFLKFADRSEYIVYMTGTPLENNVDEFCYLLSCLSPETAREVQDIRYLAKAELFRKKIASVYLRRRREDVLQELPEITWSNEWTDMTFSEFEAYRDSVMAGNFMEMRRVSWNALESMKAARLLELCNDAASEHRKVIVFSYFRETLQFVEKLLS